MLDRKGEYLLDRYGSKVYKGDFVRIPTNVLKSLDSYKDKLVSNKSYRVDSLFGSNVCIDIPAGIKYYEVVSLNRKRFVKVPGSEVIDRGIMKGILHEYPIKKVKII